MEHNFKAEIAEALYDSSINVSKDALLWAMSNLPDDNKTKGEYSASFKTEFNHDDDTVTGACGLTEERAQEAAKILTTHIRKFVKDGMRVSNIVEDVLNEVQTNPDILKVLVIKSVQDAIEHAEQMTQMGDVAKMLKMMKKLKGGKDLDLDI